MKSYKFEKLIDEEELSHRDLEKQKAINRKRDRRLKKDFYSPRSFWERDE